MLFPLLNLSNDFPLVAITLASNFDQFVPQKWTRTKKRARVAYIVVRVCCVVPPVIAGSILGELDTIFTFTGLFAFFLVFIIPCIFQWLSKRTMVKIYGPGADHTPYTGTGFWSLKYDICRVLQSQRFCDRSFCSWHCCFHLGCNYCHWPLHIWLTPLEKIQFITFQLCTLKVGYRNLCIQISMFVLLR